MINFFKLLVGIKLSEYLQKSQTRSSRTTVDVIETLYWKNRHDWPYGFGCALSTISISITVSTGINRSRWINDKMEWIYLMQLYSSFRRGKQRLNRVVEYIMNVDVACWFSKAASKKTSRTAGRSNQTFGQIICENQVIRLEFFLAIRNFDKLAFYWKTRAGLGFSNLNVSIISIDLSLI